MEQLLDMARRVSDQAEVYALEYANNTVSFENAKLHDIDSKFQSGVSLRIIKNGKLGFAYTKNLLNREALVQNALDSLAGGVEAAYHFPQTTAIATLQTYNPAIETVSSAQMVEECARVCETLAAKTHREIAVRAVASTGSIRIINSAGTDVSTRFSEYDSDAQIIYPGSGSGIEREIAGKAFIKMSDDLLNTMIALYQASANVITPAGGKMKVIFAPNSLYTLTWRLLSGLNAQNVYEKISPMAEKVGKKIFSDNLTVYDAPLDDSYPGARAFDDEGTASQFRMFVNAGVVQEFYADLNYAKKLKMPPTGHGYKTAQWGGEAISLKPSPAMAHFRIKPGAASLAEMIKSVDRGIIVEGALGAHSGNIPNGDYSIGVQPGLYVENGEIVGRVKDAMVAGNMYETLQHVLAVENSLHYSFTGWVPAILCDQVSVAIKR